MRWPVALALPLAACSGGGEAAPRATARPMRVMSTNLCTDQLVLALLPPARIASVTWLARDPSGSLLTAAAARVPINHGSAEDVVYQRPDLVITGATSTPATRAMLHRLGYPVVEVPHAASFEAIRAATRQVARAVGEVARGEALIARMDAQLAELGGDPAPPLRVAAWDGGGFGASEGTLFNEVLVAAGAVNVASRPPAKSYRRADAEVLLQAAPDVLIKGSAADRAPGRRAEFERHPVVRRFWGERRTIALRQAWFGCGTPFAAEGARRLRDELRAVAQGLPTAPVVPGYRP
ncbi:ABC transporter substrate-binding protein [uncultured Sphingomonas sp.]|uniref:ABC transporter substrate-binding protein n=1 Tax=uncultured Sphingomonas sp. TaxID=158754 RepID=UPI002621CD02|nr:ABC transporter substrate-binding protein [uncultured Sphingomonas sp.]